MKFFRFIIFIARSMYTVSMYPNIRYKGNIYSRLGDIQQNKETEVQKSQTLAANILKLTVSGNKVRVCYHLCIFTSYDRACVRTAHIFGNRALLFSY